VPDAIEVAPGIEVPGSAVQFRAVRSSGPGGQNVNKVASKVELRVDLALVRGLDEGARARLAALAASRTDRNGLLLVTSQRTRDQARNLEDARDKVRRLVARALLRRRPRRPTRPGAAAHERRLDEKKRRSRRKRSRASVQDD
jgi:ribosome-associated protein